MRLFPPSSKSKKKSEDAKRQKERELRYRSERDEWRRIAKNAREFASRRYLRGHGIEIGGLHRPLPLYEGAKAKYVDRMSTEEVRRYYANVSDLPQVTVDIVDDGETLGTIPDASVDFVVANHMLEHTRNPIATVENFLRVAKPGGMVYMAIPDKRYTFDIKRPVTPLEHIREDYARGPDWSDREHYEEWARKVREFPGGEPAVQAYVEKSLAEHTNIHFHVWTYVEIVEMFLMMRRELGFPLDLMEAIQNGNEVIVVLRKQGGAAEASELNAAEHPAADAI